MCVFASLILSACDRKLTVGAIYQCTAHMYVSLLGNIRSVSFMCRGSHWLSPCFYLFIYLFVFVHLWHDVNYCPVQWIWQWDRMEIGMERGTGRGEWELALKRKSSPTLLTCVFACCQQRQNGQESCQTETEQQQQQHTEKTTTTTTTLAAAETPCSHAPYPMGKFGFLFFLFFRIFDFVSHLFSLRIENLCKYFLVYWLFHPFRGMEVCQLSWDPA